MEEIGGDVKKIKVYKIKKRKGSVMIRVIVCTKG